MDERVPYEMENDLQTIYESLRKDTAQQMSLHKSFFRKICRSKIDKIYSFGFAFADVDLPYIEKICSLIDTRDITWHLNDYDCIQKRKEYQKNWKNVDFKVNLVHSQPSNPYFLGCNFLGLFMRTRAVAWANEEHHHENSTCKTGKY